MKLGLIGAGNMASALARGIGEPILVADVDSEKAETLARELGGEPLVELIVEESHTCYRGERGPRHTWGYGCGACPACELRERGFNEWRRLA